MRTLSNILRRRSTFLFVATILGVWTFTHTTRDFLDTLGQCVLLIFVWSIVYFGCLIWLDRLKTSATSQQRTHLPISSLATVSSAIRHKRLRLTGTTTSPQRRHIEELRSLRPTRLIACAEALSRYGDMTDALNILADLTPTDQLRFLCLSLLEGQETQRTTAQQLLRGLNPHWVHVEKALSTLSQEDREEIQQACVPSPTVTFGQYDQVQVIHQLTQLAAEIGSLSYEEAVWALLPNAPGQESMWVDATGGSHSVTSRVRFHSDVLFDITPAERYELLSYFRQARWILHIHNHPIENIEDSEGVEPSTTDQEFAASWKSSHPELGDRMKFFVLSGRRVMEYALPGNRQEPWVLPE